jgi:transcriptional regulator with XRE-family HTH domain
MASKRSKPEPENSPESINENLGRRVKKLRTDRGWSLEDLSNTSGVSRSMLSEIEREKANPTLTVTFRIARAFGMTLQDLIQSAEDAKSKVQVIRATDSAQIYRADKQCEIRTLSPINLEKDVELYQLKLKPGGALRSQAHFEGAREFITVQDGSVRVESDQDTETLSKGDSGTYRADVPHAIVNTSKGASVVILVVIYR